MSRTRHRHRRNKLFSLYLWHRHAGLFAALFVILLALSGIALNHSAELRLEERHLKADWLLDWYGVEPPKSYQHYPLDEHHITLLGNRLFYNNRHIPGHYSNLKGAAFQSGLMLIVVDDLLLLQTADGQLVEQLAVPSIPTGIESIGLDANGNPVVATRKGYFQPDSQLLEWYSVDTARDQISWATPTQLGQEHFRPLARHVREHTLTLERLVLDLHSGRFFGQSGPWIMDITALFLIFLAASGTTLWLKRALKHK